MASYLSPLRPVVRQTISSRSAENMLPKPGGQTCSIYLNFDFLQLIASEDTEYYTLTPESVLK